MSINYLGELIKLAEKSEKNKYDFKLLKQKAEEAIKEIKDAIDKINTK